MNKYKLLFKFISCRGDNNKYNWNLLFPFVGVIIGCMTVALTCSIMEGMEYAIFTKLKEVTFPGKLKNVSSVNGIKFNKYLNEQSIQFQKGKEAQVMIMNKENFRLVTLHGIEKFKEFRAKGLNEDMNSSIDLGIIPGIYIGQALSVRLDLSLGDTAIIVHPEKINIFTGLPNQKKMVVGGIFELNIINYDQQHIFCRYDAINHFIPNKHDNLYLYEKLTDKQNVLINKDYPAIQYQLWEENYQSFISAMKLEKYTYSIIGFLIVCIAGFTLMSMMSLSVIQKIPQIGILRAIGMKSQNIGYVFIIQAIITSVISSTIGILLSIYMIYLDGKYHLIHFIFPGALHFIFPLILKSHYIVLI